MEVVILSEAKNLLLGIPVADRCRILQLFLGVQLSLRSRQVGFFSSTGATFLARSQPLSFFSRAMALFMYSKLLNHTSRSQLYLTVYPA